MALKDLLTDLSNFRYTDYGSAGSIQSQVSGRHGTPDAPIDNSDFDNGVGFGQDPNSTPQSFSVRGYQITGNKRFIVNYGGGILDNDGSIYGLGEFNNIAGIGGVGTAYYSNLNPISPRGSIYRDDSGNYRVPQEFGNTNPPGTTSGIVGFNQTQLTLNIPQIVLTGPFEDTYQSQLNTEPISPNAHGSDFFTSPLTNYTSQFSLDNLNTNIDSGFDRGSMYIENTVEPNEIIFKQFTRGDSSLRRISLTSPNFNPFVFGSGLPYVIPQHTSTGPTQFSVGGFSDDPLIPDLHGSDFMTRPSYTSQISTETATHNVSMINLSGPTTQDYQTTINLDSVAENAHGSDFLTTPLTAFSSRFANQNEFLMNTVFDSGFNTDDFYVGESNRGPTSFGEFKQFTKSENSLKTISLDSPNVDPDGNEFYTFPDRKPYNFDARDNTIFGFDQPFILKDIGDKWGPNVESTLDEGLVRGGVVTSVARGIADGLRLTKFLLTPKGILFLAKQAGLQLLNPRGETSLFNPLSLGSGNTSAAGVPLRIDRHLGGLNYETSPFGPAGITILNAYAGAIETGMGWSLIQSGMRSTLAHKGGMVPGAGGKVSFNAEPEIAFDSGENTIRSLSTNTFNKGSSGLLGEFFTNPIGQTEPNFNIYDRGIKPLQTGKKYHEGVGSNALQSIPSLSNGTSGVSLVRRVTGDDIGSPVDYSETYPDLAAIKSFSGVEDEPTIHGAGGLKGINRRDGGYSITLGGDDSIIGIPNGNLYDEGEESFPYQQNHNKGSVIPIGLGVSGYGYGPSHGLSAFAEKGTNFEQYEGKGKAFEITGEFGNIPVSQLAVVQTNIFQADTYNRKEPYGDALNQIGGNRSDGTLGVAVYRKKYYHSISGDGPVVPISPNRDNFNQNGYALDTVPSDLKLKETKEWSGDTYSQENPYADKPSIFIGDKTMLVMGGSDIKDRTLQIGNPLSDIVQNKISIQKKSAFTHKFANDRVTEGKDSVLPYNDDLLYGNYTSLQGGQYETNPERFQDINADETLIKQQGVKGSIGLNKRILFGGDVNNSGGKPEEKEIFTTSDADTNQYSKTKKYAQRVDVDGKNNFKSIFFNNDKLKGDPTVDFKTQYVDTDKFNRGGSSPQQGPFEKTAKLQDFPLINDENSGGNYGNEGQALGFLKGGGRKDNHGDNFYGTDDGRLAFGDSKYSQQVGDGTKYQPDGELTIPTDTKKINYQHNVAEVQEGDIGENVVEANFPSNVRVKSGTVNPVGDLNRYKTLAYGQLPSGETNKSNKYSERVIESDDKQPVKPQLDSTDATIFRDRIGLVKIKSDRGNLLDRIDNLNMIEYGKDYGEVDDYIKFKFFDTINKKHIIFPATLSGISDSLSPEWNSEKYIGRPDNVHVYTGTNRELSFSFKVAVMSKQQLLVCWEKLNYLIGLTYPTWKTVGNSARMEAPFIELTIGDMFNRTPGFINSLGYSVDDNTPWDIDEGTQLPKAIDVEVTFTHIGRHKLASQGKHYDLPWLRPLDKKPNPDVENSVYSLGQRIGAYNSGNIFTKNEQGTQGGVSSN
tara:strand:+ start:529 stop:5166 length:4638 start_codon:yes stop_codon:yes gene_type:complete